jgi:hypothetical protein
MADHKMCAHTGCKCLAAEGSSYCSTYCEDSKDLTTLECDCNHPMCEGQKL